MPIVGDRRNPYPPPAEVLYFLIHDEERREKGYKFPSPLGELYFLITFVTDLRVNSSVSVPSRGAIFLNNVINMVRHHLSLVSVPSRGAIFLNKTGGFDPGRLYEVSVPSRGAIFLNLIGMMNESFSYMFKFPSPLGELYFLIKMELYRRTCNEIVSVPSRGAIFLNERA